VACLRGDDYGRDSLLFLFTVVFGEFDELLRSVLLALAGRHGTDVSE
jgi:hypothetical protein